MHESDEFDVETFSSLACMLNSPVYNLIDVMVKNCLSIWDWAILVFIVFSCELNLTSIFGKINCVDYMSILSKNISLLLRYHGSLRFSGRGILSMAHISDRSALKFYLDQIGETKIYFLSLVCFYNFLQNNATTQHTLPCS